MTGSQSNHRQFSWKLRGRMMPYIIHCVIPNFLGAIGIWTVVASLRGPIAYSYRNTWSICLPRAYPLDEAFQRQLHDIQFQIQAWSLAEGLVRNQNIVYLIIAGVYLFSLAVLWSLISSRVLKGIPLWWTGNRYEPSSEADSSTS